MPTNNNLKLLDKKEWQNMTPAPVASAAAMFVVEPPSNLPRMPVLYVTTATTCYEYWPEEDAWMNTPNAALGGTFGAGACGCHVPWSITYTATGGNAAGTTVTVAAASYPLTSAVVGKTIEFLTVSNIGVRRVITGIDAQGDISGNTITLTLDYAVGTQVTTNTFRIASGRFFVICAGTLSATSQKQFDIATQAWSAVTNTGLSATWGTDGAMVSTARMCPVLANGAASSGSTTTLVDTNQNWAVNQWANQYVMMVSGTGAGQCLKILSNTATTLTFATVTTAPAAATVYQIRGGAALACGVATSGSATTVVNSAKTWTAHQWINYQVRILSGTGAGQISKITENTATTLTIGSGATIDNTSVYEIEPLENSIYLLGNNAVTMYLYSISGNSWSTVAPTTARGAAPVAGMSAEFVAATGDPIWANESANQEGMYIYSFRGGGANTLDRFNIAGGTAGAGAWAALVMTTLETIASGSAVAYSGRFLHIRLAAGYRFLKYDIPGNEILPLATNLYGDGAAVLGSKSWVKSLDPSELIQWLYSLQNTGTVLHRLGLVNSAVVPGGVSL